MYTNTIEYFVLSAQRRVAQLRQNPMAFLAGSVCGGAYIGLGVVLIPNVGSHLPADYQELGMGSDRGLRSEEPNASKAVSIQLSSP